MNERRVPSVAKWPFYLADAVLLGLAVWIVNHYPHPLPIWSAALMAGCVASAAALCVWPYRLEYQTAVQFAESDGLTDAVQEIRHLQTVAEQIRLATGQWQGVQEHSAKTVTTAKEISERITVEAQAFSEFMQKANDAEKATLRLEVEKLRRGEGQWLQVLVNLLDHVFALYQAGAHSGQPNLEAQLGRFQEACRDVVRRVGLTPFEAQLDEPFDATKHQLADDQSQPPPDALIAQTLAAGYTFQGQLVRRSLVALRSPNSGALVSPGASQPSPVEPQTEPELTSEAGHGDALGTSEDFVPNATAELSASHGFRLESESPANDAADTRQA